MKPTTLTASFVCLALLPLPGWAEVLSTTDPTIRDWLCIGEECATNFTDIPDGQASGLVIRDTRTRIDFVDTSLESSSFPSNDWSILTNDTFSSGEDYFAVQDTTAGTRPFSIQGGAPENALWLDATGRVGLGTSLPGANLHVVTPNYNATLRLEEQYGPPYAWDVSANDVNFFISDANQGTYPFRINWGAPTGSFVMTTQGDIGLGTTSPDAPLEVSEDATHSFVRLTATSASPNESVDVVFTQGPLGTGELRYNIVDGDGPEMRLNADGDVTLTGSLMTTGPTCAAGCDRVFDAGYDLRTIEEHSALMWENRHLPAIGATQPGARVNVTEKMGNMLNELEHAHIYIADLNTQLNAQRTVFAAALAAQQAEIDALKALIKQ